MYYICSIFASNVLSFYQMSKEKVNPVYSLADSSCDNAGEGLRVLARIIARRLVRKSNDEGQLPRPGLSSGRSDKNAGMQSPGNNGDRKKAANLSGCGSHTPDAVMKEGDGVD